MKKLQAFLILLISSTMLYGQEPKIQFIYPTSNSIICAGKAYRIKYQMIESNINGVRELQYRVNEQNWTRYNDVNIHPENGKVLTTDVWIPSEANVSIQFRIMNYNKNSALATSDKIDITDDCPECEWELIHNLGLGENWGRIRSIGKNKLIVAHNNLVTISTDAGNSWTKIYETNPTQSNYQMTVNDNDSIIYILIPDNHRIALRINNDGTEIENISSKTRINDYDWRIGAAGDKGYVVYSDGHLNKQTSNIIYSTNGFESHNITTISGAVCDMTYKPDNNNTFFACGHINNNPTIWKSTNGGANWSMSHQLSFGRAYRYIKFSPNGLNGVAFAWDQDMPAGFYGSYTTDGGNSWQNIVNSNLPLNAKVWEASYLTNEIVFAVFASGPANGNVGISFNGGKDWYDCSKLDAEFGVIGSITNDDNCAFILSNCGKVFQYCIEDPTSIDDKLKHDTLLFVFPNPTSDYLNISFDISLWQNQDTEIRMNNILGVCVMSKIVESWSITTKINISHLPPGVYFIQVGNDVRMFVKH